MSKECIVELPSSGLLYDDEALKSGKLRVRPLTIKEESLLGSQKEEDRISVLDVIIKKCLLDPIPYEKLLITDKLYILFYLRRISYGDDYKVNVKCDSCGFQFSHNLKFFESFVVKKLEGEESEPYSVKLSSSGSEVKFRMLRVSDETDIVKYGRNALKRNRDNAGDPTYSYKIAKHIVSVDGKEDIPLLERIDFVENLIGMDSSCLKDSIEEKQSGLDIRYKVECPQCGNSMEEMVRFTAEFFRTVRT